MMNEEEFEILSRYLGDLLDEVVEKHGYGLDLDEEYDGLLEFIYKNLIRTWFKGRIPEIQQLEGRLREVRRRYKRKLMILLSYYISRYMKMKNILTLH